MPKILIVDDNEENRDALSSQLQNQGFQVVVAKAGKVGVEMAKEEKPDLILMDMNMPEIDGWEATRQIKATAETANVPVIALTENETSDDRDRAIAAGCVECHTKPVELQKLLSQIEDILSTAGAASLLGEGEFATAATVGLEDGRKR